MSDYPPPQEFFDPVEECKQVCQHCGRASSSVTKRYGGKVLCDDCDETINGRGDPWLRDDQ